MNILIMIVMLLVEFEACLISLKLPSVLKTRTSVSGKDLDNIDHFRKRTVHNYS